MAERFEEPGTPRFRIDASAGQDRIEIRPRRRLPLLLFISFWFIAWSCAGVAVVSTLMTHFQIFTMAWLGGWAVGWTYALLVIAWLATGSEILSVDGNLSITYQVLGVRRRKVYRGGDIRHLTSNAANDAIWRFRYVSLPFVDTTKSGGIKFGYGARTVYAGVDLDEEEARLVIEQLATRLPATVRA